MADTRVLRWRAQLAIAGVIVVILWWLYTGGPTYVIQIDYQWIGELADSAEMVIDGQVVGTLEFDPRGRPVRGFEVEPGQHVVELRTRQCDARADTVTLGPSRIAVILADFDERSTGCYVFFR